MMLGCFCGFIVIALVMSSGGGGFFVMLGGAFAVVFVVFSLGLGSLFMLFRLFLVIGGGGVIGGISSTESVGEYQGGGDTSDWAQFCKKFPEVHGVKVLDLRCHMENFGQGQRPVRANHA